MLQQAGMHIFLRTSFIYLLVRCCVGFNITIPSSPIPVGNVTSFRWNWNKADFKNSSSGAFLALLMNPPDQDNPECPYPLNNPGVGIDAVTKVFEDFATAETPTNSSEDSGNLLLSPNNSGWHIICTYGNLSRNAVIPATNSFQQDKDKESGFDLSHFFTSLNSVTFLSQSDRFNVTSSSNSTKDDDNGDGHGSNRHNNGHDGDGDNHPDNHHDAAIVGGVVGGVALIFLVLLIIFYRRLRYQRKLNQFQKEHMLFQQSPPSFHLSARASTLTPRLASPTVAAPLSLSPYRHSGAPVGFEGTMRKSYQLPSEDHSHSTSSLYSVEHPNEHVPVFRAQHPPGMYQV